MLHNVTNKCSIIVNYVAHKEFLTYQTTREDFPGKSPRKTARKKIRRLGNVTSMEFEINY